MLKKIFNKDGKTSKTKRGTSSEPKPRRRERENSSAESVASVAEPANAAAETTPQDRQKALQLKKQRVLDELKAYHEKSTTIESQPYFHGQLPREEIESEHILQEEGDFLLRESDRHIEPIIISVMWKNKILHIPVGCSSVGHSSIVKWNVARRKFDTITELLMYYVKTGNVITGSKVQLRQPVYVDEYCLRTDQIKLIKKLGEGCFGDVYLGTLTKKMDTTNDSVLVAIKTLKSDSNKQLNHEEKEKFLREARIMRRYNHKNIVKFLGICIMKAPFMIVMEYVAGGALEKYLAENKGRIDKKTLFNFCMDACEGMVYLESRRCIHRDLAARNCLLTPPPKMTLKISDFGMSREGTAYEINKTKNIPVRWTAPEAIMLHQYTSKSDVWSYGILMWEIYSDGDMPYEDIDNNRAVFEFISQGNRLPKPPEMPREMGSIMAACWAHMADDRPTFPDILEALKKVEKLLYLGLPMPITSKLTPPKKPRSPKVRVICPSSPDSSNPSISKMSPSSKQ